MRSGGWYAWELLLPLRLSAMPTARAAYAARAEKWGRLFELPWKASKHKQSRCDKNRCHTDSCCYLVIVTNYSDAAPHKSCVDWNVVQ